MEKWEQDLVKQRILEFDFVMAVNSGNDWPIHDWWSPDGGERSLGWLIAELWRMMAAYRCPAFGDLMPSQTVAALRLPPGNPGTTFVYGLRLVRRNLNRLAFLWK